MIFQRLLEVEANFFVVTEWKREGTEKSRSLIQSRRRHFHTTKRSFISYMNTSDAPASAQDVLVDDSKEAQIHELGEALKALEVKGNYFGKTRGALRRSLSCRAGLGHRAWMACYGRLVREIRIEAQDHGAARACVEADRGTGFRKLGKVFPTPSPGPPRLVKAPAAGHPLPRGERVA